MDLAAETGEPVLIARTYVEENERLHEHFRAAKPFPYLALDGFLDAEFARALLRDFPQSTGAINPFGAPGRKAFHGDLPSLGPTFAQADRWFSSRAFLSWLETVTGIAGLLYDPKNYGGGMHENFEGRDLRPHVDFNIHPVTKLHRRVNLIVYLNEDWDPRWGGNLMLYRDPRDCFDEPVVLAPDFNRCVLFETSERSWHGFDRLTFPPEQKHRTRKSLSLYFYSEERPDDEIVEEHTTFFVPRALPPRYREGYTLGVDDERELGELVGQRDRLIELYQGEQGRREPWSAEAARLRRRCAQLEAERTLPMLGYGWASGVSGCYGDGWGGAEIGFTLHTAREAQALLLRARVPDGIAADARLTVSVNGEQRAALDLAAGPIELRVPLQLGAGERAELRAAVNRTVNPHALGLGADRRDLGIFLERLELLDGHGECA